MIRLMSMYLDPGQCPPHDNGYELRPMTSQAAVGRYTRAIGGARARATGDEIRGLFSQPVLLATMSFAHGSNAFGVDPDVPADGPECERDRAGM